MPSLSRIKGPVIPPNTPTTTTTIAVIEIFPPFFAAKSIAIGVVTDLGCREAITLPSAPSAMAIAITDTIPIKLPTKTAVIIAKAFLRMCS